MYGPAHARPGSLALAATDASATVAPPEEPAPEELVSPEELAPEELAPEAPEPEELAPDVQPANATNDQRRTADFIDTLREMCARPRDTIHSAPCADLRELRATRVTTAVATGRARGIRCAP
jgi:hypothetical protein